MKSFTKEIKIALVEVTGIILLFFGLNFLNGHAFQEVESEEQ